MFGPQIIEPTGLPKGCGPEFPPAASVSRTPRQQIFERVRAAGAMSRAQVAKELGISPASVTTQTSELIEMGLLREVPQPRTPDDTGRGRPPVALGVEPSVHVVAGIKLSEQAHTAILSDFAGNELASATEPAPRSGSPAAAIAAAGRLIATAAREIGLPPASLSCAGIGLPGFIDQATGHVYWSPILTERGVDFAADAARALGIPVRIDNDANLVAMAELWFGVGRGLSDFAVVTIEHGLGMGLVVDHRVYRGAQGLGMELGHTKVQLDGALCRCGQRGCLEAYVADYALAREAAQALGRPDAATLPTARLLEILHAEAKAGNVAAQSIFRRAGRYLAAGLANVANLFDPQLVILSGGRMSYDFLYAKETLAELSKMSLDSGRGAPKIEVHAWGDLLWAYGAAALALSDVTERTLGRPREAAPA